MENITLQKDIRLFCVKATSFRGGIHAAHQKMASLATPYGKRNHYGISYLYDDEILYMAATELHSDSDPIPDGCETYTIRKGNYISIYIPGFATDSSRVEKAFKTLLDYPGIDEKGCCAECYLPEGSDGTNATDMRCMVRLAD